ncbi:protein POLLEN DEFECTIVE IN GUIDANCE 1-like [Andrographis paniculata]|uniref:protein POLLEN DEFECTIVE IN GUIDANCE 1-like n=1 Tax=Andrographis paniculata TaxID=175694 RepID=UPI0021E7D87C|nr:protein POLLEN DEFECTIVE IN GUIDANCE 1-like [Andrographis paniculata]
MASESRVRKLSFDILAFSEHDDGVLSAAASARSRSDPPPVLGGDASSPRRKKKKRKEKGKNLHDLSLICDNAVLERSVIVNNGVNHSCAAVKVTETAVASDSDGKDNCAVRTVQYGELRQRYVVNAMNGAIPEMASEESGDCKKAEMLKEDTIADRIAVKEISVDQQAELRGKQLEERKADWNKLMAEDSHYVLPAEKSPMKYFVEEINAGNSLRSTTTVGNDKERERVYDTIFRLPWRCELLINFGFFVCFDSFLSLLTIMPIRIIMSLWRLVKTRQFKRPSSAELSDFGCLVIMLSGVTLLQQADISLIYHMIRGQGIVKLYVVYNVLEAITLSTCIVSHNNALFAMLVSNNFAEIKSNVFKRYSKENIHSLVYFDSVERFHISAFVLFVLAQNILEAEGPWFESFLSNVLVVYICEVMIDVIKHSFVAKFNGIKPLAFSEFLEDLCKQTLNMQTENGKKNLTFIPLAPACVVIRVLRPVYTAYLPCTPPHPWRGFWMVALFAISFVMLASLKMMIGMGLRKHARWYVKRCERRKLHTD